MLYFFCLNDALSMHKVVYMQFLFKEKDVLNCFVRKIGSININISTVNASKT